MSNLFQKFTTLLQKTKTEEEVKNAFAKQFNLDYDTEFRYDLYSPEIDRKSVV